MAEMKASMRSMKSGMIHAMALALAMVAAGQHGAAEAQLADEAGAEAKPAAAADSYDHSTPIGPHHRLIYPPEGATNSTGGPLTNALFVLLETGMNYLDDAGSYQPANPVIEAFPEGAVVRQAQMKVIFALDINVAGVVDMLTPGNHRLRGTPLGLSYYDAKSGQSVLIAETKSAAGKIVAPNKLVYEDFLDDVKADAVYEVSKAGLMQTIVIREDIAPPSAYGLPDETTRLEVLTEFPAAPQPEKRERVIKGETDEGKRQTMASPDFKDEFLKFGDAIMPLGVAFGVNLENEAGDEVKRQPVGKHWQEMPGEGRSVLFESIEYVSAKEEFKKLPKAADKSERAAAARREIPAKRIAALKKEPVQVAVNDYREKGIAVDYQLVTQITSMTFESANYAVPGGLTYLVTNKVALNYAVFKQGCIIKFKKNNGVGTPPGIELTSTVICPTDGQRPAVLRACLKKHETRRIRPVFEVESVSS